MNSRLHASTVSRRTVLYFAGFDPRGASVYHTMTKAQFEKHCNASDLTAVSGKRKRLDKTRHSWSLTSMQHNQAITNEFQYMIWDDLVRAHWIRPDWRAILSGAWAFFRLLKLGVISHMLKTSKPVALTAGMPLMQIVAAILTFFLPAISLVSFLNGWFILGGALLVGFALAAFGTPKVMKPFNGPWIGRITSFAVASADKPILDDWRHRSEMAKHVLAAVDDVTNDEILVVAHSVGTQLGLLAIADALVLAPEKINKAAVEGRISFTTLGQTVPLMSRISDVVKDALNVLGESAVPWLDVSSPADPACYVTVDPYRNQFGKAPRVHVENARFFRAFRPDTYRAARADRFTLHFLYLMTPDAEAEKDRKSGFDLYGLMTSGNRLSERLASDPIEVVPFYKSGDSK